MPCGNVSLCIEWENVHYFALLVCVCRFDQLRIQRQIHSSDGKRAARGQGSNRARLMFEAHLNTIHGAITVTAFSRPIILGKPVCLTVTQHLPLHATRMSKQQSVYVLTCCSLYGECVVLLCIVLGLRAPFVCIHHLFTQCIDIVCLFCVFLSEAAQTPGTLAAVCPSSGGMNGGEEIVVLGHKLGPPCECPWGDGMW